MAEWENWDQNLLHWERVYLLNGMAESFREEGGIIGGGGLVLIWPWLNAKR